jgi:hypothetical protein
MVHDRSATHDTRIAPRDRSKTRSATSAMRGRAVGQRLGRSPKKRSSRPASRDRPRRDRPLKRSRTGAQQPTQRAGSGQGARKN